MDVNIVIVVVSAVVGVVLLLMLMATIVIFIVIIATRYREKHNTGSSDGDSIPLGSHNDNNGEIENVENNLYDDVLLQGSSNKEREPTQTNSGGNKHSVNTSIDHGEMVQEINDIADIDHEDNKRSPVTNDQLGRKLPLKPPRETETIKPLDDQTDSGCPLYSVVNKEAAPEIPPKTFLD